MFLQCVSWTTLFWSKRLFLQLISTWKIKERFWCKLISWQREIISQDTRATCKVNKNSNTILKNKNIENW